MKKIDLKYGIISFILLLLGLVIKGVLDSTNASMSMYAFAWLPLVIAFICDVRYLYKKNKEEM